MQGGGDVCLDFYVENVVWFGKEVAKSMVMEVKAGNDVELSSEVQSRVSLACLDRGELQLE